MDSLTRSVALHVLKQAKLRDAEHAEERARERRLPVSKRSDDWQSYCTHGTYIGDPYGPDLMCWKCEAGVSVYDEALEEAHERTRRFREQVAAMQTLRTAFGGHLPQKVEDTLFGLALDTLGLGRNAS